MRLLEDEENSESSENGNCRKQLELQYIIPVRDVKKMDCGHWTNLYASEQESVARDDGSILGGFQPHITRTQRFHIVTWMSEACAVLGWTAQTFYVAVHAMDYYVTTVTHDISQSDFGPLATSCLYFGAQLVESATDENVYTLDKFQSLCPEVGKSEVVRDSQAHLIDALQGVSLCRKTPCDFMLLYLAEMAASENPTVRQLYQVVTQRGLLSTLFDLASVTGLALYTSGLCLDMLGSRIVMCAVLRTLEFACHSTKHQTTSFRQLICEKVFHLPNGLAELSPYLELTNEMIMYFAQVVCGSPLKKSSAPGNVKAVASATSPTNSSLVIGDLNDKHALAWAKHIHPKGLADWPFACHSKKIDQLGQKLQKLQKHVYLRYA